MLTARPNAGCNVPKTKQEGRDMSAIELVFNTNVLLAWVIVAIGLLGFIIAHTIEKWYKAILPGLVALAIIAFGLYCVLRMTREAQTNKPDTPNESEEDTQPIERSSTPEPAPQQPPQQQPLANLKDQLATEVLPTFYMREEKSLKITVTVRNNGPMPVTSARIGVWLPYKSQPRSGPRMAQLFRFEKPLEPGKETTVTLSFPITATPESYKEPVTHIYEAH